MRYGFIVLLGQMIGFCMFRIVRARLVRGVSIGGRFMIGVVVWLRLWRRRVWLVLSGGVVGRGESLM